MLTILISSIFVGKDTWPFVYPCGCRLRDGHERIILFFCVEKTREHVSVHWQQGTCKCKLSSNCFMLWCVASKPRPLDLGDTYSPITAATKILAIRLWPILKKLIYFERTPCFRPTYAVRPYCYFKGLLSIEGAIGWLCVRKHHIKIKKCYTAAEKPSHIYVC